MSVDSIIPKHNQSLVKNDKGYYLNVKLSHNYLPFSITPIKDSRFYMPTETQIMGWFNHILDGSIPIENIDGVSLNESTQYKCDLCLGDINGDYYYCQICRLDICPMCYINEKGIGSEPIHIVNCVRNHQIDMVKRYVSTGEICAMCHIINNLQLSPIETEVLYTDGEYFMCDNCALTSTGQILINEHKLSKTMNKLPCYQKFGSLFDWIPLIFNNVGNCLLMNYNPSSPYKLRYALYKHNEINIFPVHLSMDDMLDKLYVKNMTTLVAMEEEPIIVSANLSMYNILKKWYVRNMEN